MKTLSVLAFAILLTGFSQVSNAAEKSGAYQAVRPEFMLASDADGNDTRKLSLAWDAWRIDREHWVGVEVQNARFSGRDWSKQEQRAYLRAAGVFTQTTVTDDSWRWQVRAGSNGHALLGGASLNTEGPRRIEFFFERELLETEAGARRGQVYNFLGAAMDHPFTDKFSGTLLAGLQDFDDGNLRSHLRGNLVQVLVPSWGLSVQLRGRYYRNSEPYSGDYYSPEWYGEAVGALAFRRVIGGHSWRAVAGMGRQRSSDDNWKRARMLELSYESPRWRRSWLRVTAGYSDTPVATSTGIGSYNYRYVALESVIAF